MLVVAEREQLPVRAARAGSSEAWDALFKRYQMPLYVYVFELVHSEQSSVDIVQETFINAALHIEKLRDDAKFSSGSTSQQDRKRRPCLQGAKGSNGVYGVLSVPKVNAGMDLVALRNFDDPL